MPRLSKAAQQRKNALSKAAQQRKNARNREVTVQLEGFPRETAEINPTSEINSTSGAVNRDTTPPAPPAIDHKASDRDTQTIEERSDESECESSEVEEDMDPNSILSQGNDSEDAFKMMLQAAKSNAFDKFHARYQRHSKPHKRTLQRKRKIEREATLVGEDANVKKIKSFLTTNLSDSSQPTSSPSESV